MRNADHDDSAARAEPRPALAHDGERFARLMDATTMARTLSRLAHEVREALSGNLCRCTGYQNIVDAMLAAAQAMQAARP